MIRKGELVSEATRGTAAWFSYVQTDTNHCRGRAGRQCVVAQPTPAFEQSGQTRKPKAQQRLHTTTHCGSPVPKQLLWRSPKEEDYSFIKSKAGSWWKMQVPEKYCGIKNGFHLALSLSVPEFDASSGNSRYYKTFYQINHLYISQGWKKTLLTWVTHSCGVPINWDLNADPQNVSEITIMSMSHFPLPWSQS